MPAPPAVLHAQQGELDRRTLGKLLQQITLDFTRPRHKPVHYVAEARLTANEQVDGPRQIGAPCNSGPPSSEVTA